MYYKLQGKDIVKCKDINEWVKFMEIKKRILFVDVISDATISTVFLGLDHNFGGGIPVLFETMIFGGKSDNYLERYSTWDDAEEGHKFILKQIKNKGYVNEKPESI